MRTCWTKKIHERAGGQGKADRSSYGLSRDFVKKADRSLGQGTCDGKSRVRKSV